MSGSVQPPPEPLEGRTFAFYPPIVNVEHNQWRFRKGTWSELCVVNTASDLEVWIPRRLLGEISSVEEPLVIVGLAAELEYKAGKVWPHTRRVLEMPRPGGPPEAPELRPTEVSNRARLLGLRSAAGAETRVGRLIGYVLGGLLVAGLLVYAVSALAPLRQVKFAAIDEDVLSLTRFDDYFSIVRKLGPPADDRWRPQSGELQYRILAYPRRSCYLILVGGDRSDARYIGAVDARWRVLHAVDLPRGDTGSMLRSLPKF
jgi:hypothetical protein